MQRQESGFPGDTRSPGPLVQKDPFVSQAYYNEYKATFSIDTLELKDGDFPRKQTRLVQAWAELHQEELKADWALAMNGETPYKIAPLV